MALLRYCRKHDWAGYDPYDALNSRVFIKTPFYKSRICRIAITQIMKRLPINLRPLLLIKEEQNPKAIALFLSALIKLSKMRMLDDANLIEKMIDKLRALRSPDVGYSCWGYSFPWQTRTVLVPRGAPNLVCTTFVANALLDAFEYTGASKCLEMATSAADYILNELYWTEGDTVACFSYPLPSSRTRVHNANFLGAALLCRIYKHTDKKKYIEPALKVARYSASKQYDDGSWDYGELSTQQWVDNFHTGYNLCALRSISRNTGETEFEAIACRGFEFYKNNFFCENSAPKYFHNRIYPLDIHSVAQSIITLMEFKDISDGSEKMATAVIDWAMNNMWNKSGYFNYQILPYYKNTISYMRWSQAWMLLALATLLDAADTRATLDDNSQCRSLSGLGRHNFT